VATFLALVLPAFGTAIGGLALLAFPDPSERTLDTLLGFTGGVMLSAAAFGLFVPALEDGPTWVVVVGLAAGAGVIVLLDRLVPHAHARFAERHRLAAEDHVTAVRPWLLLSAMTIHNLPEGLAVGAAFAAGGWELGAPVAVAIGVQNIPEGFAAAAPLLRAGTPVRHAVLLAAATGLVEAPAALLAYSALEAVGPLLVAGLAFAGGAMLYVVVDELIPESHLHGNERGATLALLCGFALMLGLEQAMT
jgi:ZIP family zinc transporter